VKVMRALPSRQRLLALAALGVTGVALTACGSDTSSVSSGGGGGGGGGGGANAVTIQNFAFSPVTLTVPVGTTVTWANQDGSTHTATADDKSFDTANIAPGASGSATLGKAGTFAYHCTIHQYMTGTIVVR
jgi:plastocyanin